MNSGQKKPTVLPPPKVEPDPKDDAPLKSSSGNGLGDSINILEAIIGLFTTKDPIGFCTISKYRKVLNIQLEHKWLFRIILIPFTILDWIQSALAVLAIIIILFLVVFAIAKLVGFTDWYDNHFQLPSIATSCQKVEVSCLPQPTP